MTTIGWYVSEGGPVLALVGIGLAAWLVFGALTDFAERIALFRRPLGISLRRAIGLPRGAYGGMLAHAGVGILIAGAVAASAWKTERIQMMRVGDAVAVGAFTLRLDSVGQLSEANYVAERAQMTVLRDGAEIGVMTPERRFYPVERQNTTEAAIRASLFGDLYAVIGEPDEAGAWVTRLYFEPLVGWIWAGAVMMAAAGVLSLSDRRVKIAAAARGRAPAKLAMEA
jgi:cytochrome c-type biogenesis protein CcmF